MSDDICNLLCNLFESLFLISLYKRRNSEQLSSVIDGMRTKPVSYTHLDVYKRQVNKKNYTPV